MGAVGAVGATRLLRSAPIISLRNDIDRLAIYSTASISAADMTHSYTSASYNGGFQSATVPSHFEPLQAENRACTQILARACSCLRSPEMTDFLVAVAMRCLVGKGMSFACELVMLWKERDSSFR